MRLAPSELDRGLVGQGQSVDPHRISNSTAQVRHTKKTTRTFSDVPSDSMEREVRLRLDGSAESAARKSPLPVLPVGVLPPVPVGVVAELLLSSAESRGLLTLAVFLELFVDAASLGGTLGAGAVRSWCRIGGAVGSEG